MSEKVVIYSSRWCPFCMRALNLLNSKEVAFTEIDVDKNPQERVKMREMAGRNSVPQIWIGDHHVGGCDELFALERSGELDQLLARN
ncbi:MAG TPA: glutaredoxin 3 [Alcanivoracaceae bacterium]|nr:glutaredoxin 3 [Alcanivoracaceae bacterium]